MEEDTVKKGEKKKKGEIKERRGRFKKGENKHLKKSIVTSKNWGVARLKENVRVFWVLKEQGWCLSLRGKKFRS